MCHHTRLTFFYLIGFQDTTLLFFFFFLVCIYLMPLLVLPHLLHIFWRYLHGIYTWLSNTHHKFNVSKKTSYSALYLLSSFTFNLTQDQLKIILHFFTPKTQSHLQISHFYISYLMKQQIILVYLQNLCFFTISQIVVHWSKPPLSYLLP